MFGLPTREEKLDVALHEIGKERGDEKTLVDALFDMLPDDIKLKRAMLDPVLGLWRYDFGRPIRVEGLVQSTSEFPQLSKLYDALLVANARLSPAEQSSWARLLGQRDQHRIWREEMLAILHVAPNAKVEYERAGLCQGTKSADWHVATPDGPRLLFDVKYRMADTIEFLEEVAAQIRAGATQLDDDAIEIDVSTLFRSLVEKFKPDDPSQMLQGGWIRTSINHDDVESYFDGLDAERLHFAVLPQDNRPAVVLARTVDQAAHVTRVLGLIL